MSKIQGKPKLKMKLKMKLKPKPKMKSTTSATSEPYKMPNLHEKAFVTYYGYSWSASQEKLSYPKIQTELLNKPVKSFRKIDNLLQKVARCHGIKYETRYILGDEDIGGIVVHRGSNGFLTFMGVR